MTNNQVDVNQFIVEMMEVSTRGIKRTTEGLSDEHLRRLALRRKPWVFGVRVFHPHYRYSCQHSHF